MFCLNDFIIFFSLTEIHFPLDFAAYEIFFKEILQLKNLPT